MIHDDTFKIYIEQLREGVEKPIHQELDPSFLDVHEEDLTFIAPVKLTGVVYTADDELIFNWNIQTEALVACSICNQKVEVPILITNFYHAEPIEQIKTGIFDYKELLRETILLEVPSFAECEGNCPRREEIARYLKEPEKGGPEGYQPFADLDWK